MLQEPDVARQPPVLFQHQVHLLRPPEVLHILRPENVLAPLEERAPLLLAQSLGDAYLDSQFFFTFACVGMLERALRAT
jgi:hypothetical protein